VTRAATLVGYGALACCLVALQVAGFRRPDAPTIGTLAAIALRRPAGLGALVVAWLWLGWHLLARVHTR